MTNAVRKAVIPAWVVAGSQARAAGVAPRTSASKKDAAAPRAPPAR